MKNLYTKLLAVMMLCSFGAYSQSGSNAIPVKHLPKNNTPSFAKAVKQENRKDFDNPIYTSDFSDPSEWVIGNESGNNDNWVIGTGVPSGDYAIPGITSTTAANGFAMFDSDLLCSGNQNAWIQNADPIDLTGTPNVSIRFETAYRAFQGSCYIETSTDGTNWGNTVQVLDLAVNESTPNPQILQLPLLGIGGSATAYFRFRYEGGCDYAWMVDDIAIAATPGYDASINTAYYDNWMIISQSILTDPSVAEDVALVGSYEYGSYMKDQVRPLSFVATVSNLGSLDLTGVTLNVTITAPDGSTQEVSSDGSLSLPVNASDTIVINDVDVDAFDLSGTNPQLGSYSVDFNISTTEEDSYAANNNAPQKFFTVSNETMANDLGADYSGVYSTLGQDVIWGNRMVFEEAQQVNFIQFALLSNSTVTTLPGELIYLNVRTGSVFTEPGDNQLELAFGDEELEYITEESEISSPEGVVWVTQFFPDDEAITLNSGLVHQPEIFVPAGGTPYIFVPIINGQEDIAGALYDYNDVSTGPQGWWSLGVNTPLIRMGFNTGVGVDGPTDLDFKVGQNYPNPTMGQTQIDWELMKPAQDIFLMVTDQTGKIVYREQLGDRPAGVQEPLVLNLNLAAGIYQYGLQIGNQRIVRKMTIVK